MQLFLEFLTHRFTQLAVRLLTIVCAAVFGADAVNSPDAQTAIGQGASWLLAGILTFLLDLVIHSAQFGKLKAWWAAYKSYRGGGGTLALLIAAGLLLAVMSGCAQTEKNRVAQAMIASRVQADYALALHNAGITTPAQEAQIGAMLKAQAAAEDAYYASILAGDSQAMKAAKASLAAASVALQYELAKYPTPPKPTTPKPATQTTNPPTTLPR